MKLVIGGLGAGKREFVKNAWYYYDSDIADGILNDCPIVYNLQNIGDLLSDETIAKLLKKEIIICNEIGCGIVPIDAKDRAWREETGRCCTMLAKYATTVVRVYCGIGIAIKGEI